MCVVVTIGVIVFGGLVALTVVLILQATRDLDKNDWTATECYSCTNFTISGSGSCVYGKVICQQNYYEAYVKYPRSKSSFCASKSAVTAWFESIKGKNITCAVEYMDKNSDAYNRCETKIDRYCY